VLYAMLGRLPDVQSWLSRSYTEATRAGAEAAESVAGLIEALPHIKVPPRKGHQTPAAPPAGVLQVFDGARPEPAPRAGQRWHPGEPLYVEREPLASVLTGLADTQRDIYRLRSCWAVAGGSGPWSNPANWRMELDPWSSLPGVSLHVPSDAASLRPARRTFALYAADGEPVPWLRRRARSAIGAASSSAVLPSDAGESRDVDDWAQSASLCPIPGNQPQNPRV
jgi:hypothetical protein